jgi:uncharacterized protein YjbI with pentapeptide repeats
MRCSSKDHENAQRLSDANLHNSDLTGASLWGAQLSGARLERAIGISDEQLKNAHRA